ncbi:hypothetical protein RHSIM_RhsimUnG0249700 [Rhododendron simsii]|uniref:Uncharacterized protein n=1 Tax=Rhododendron simsii TaxID=118357 RepID=A0A834FV30_RHOSS|nr:hypothetical protein RHSIM_RhsimUnG0249700 [Rhododendron simsii]
MINMKDLIWKVKKDGGENPLSMMKEADIDGEDWAISMEGRYGWTSLKNEEFQEEDIWAVLKESTDFTTSKVGSSDSPTSNSRQQLPKTSSIMIPRANNNSAQEQKILPKSAPVKIPDWSKIYGAGRTLKGRDLSRVRNTVLTKTGFLE